MSALGRGDALDDRAPRALLQLAAGAPECDGRDGLALRAVRAGPDRAVHAIEGDEAPAGVAHGHADADVHLLGLRHRGVHDLVGFAEAQWHDDGLLSLSGAQGCVVSGGVLAGGRRWCVACS